MILTRAWNYCHVSKWTCKCCCYFVLAFNSNFFLFFLYFLFLNEMRAHLFFFWYFDLLVLCFLCFSFIELNGFQCLFIQFSKFSNTWCWCFSLFCHFFFCYCCSSSSFFEVFEEQIENCETKRKLSFYTFRKIFQISKILNQTKIKIFIRRLCFFVSSAVAFISLKVVCVKLYWLISFNNLPKTCENLEIKNTFCIFFRFWNGLF